MAAKTIILGAAAAIALVIGGATSTAAQTWGQPVYIPAPAIAPYGGGAYAATGRLATGYGAYGYYVAPSQRHYGYGYGAYDRGGRYGWSDPYGHGYGYRQGYRYPRYDSGRRAGYRDWYGYNDDRPPSRYRDRGYDRDCDCRDLYLYDR